MKTTINVLLAILIISCLNACDEGGETILTNVVNHGSAVIKVVDLNDQAVSDANIEIGMNTETSPIPLIESKSNSDGILKCEKLLSGFYSIEVYAVKEGRTYLERRDFQISDGQEETVILSPFEQTGNVSILVADENQAPVPGVNIIMMYGDHRGDNYKTFAEFEDLIYYQAVSDTEGMVHFTDVPSNQYIDVIAYYTKNSFEYFWGGGRSNVGITKYRSITLKKI